MTNAVTANAKNPTEATPEKPGATEANVVTSTNAPDAKLLTEVKEKLKEAAEKLSSASTSLVTAEKEFKKAELTKSIDAHELELGTNSLLKAE